MTTERRGYRIEITDRELIEMPRSELVRWIVPGQFGYQPGRRFRCDICIEAGLDPLLRRDQQIPSFISVFTVECDADEHERYYSRFA